MRILIFTFTFTLFFCNSYSQERVNDLLYNSKLPIISNNSIKKNSFNTSLNLPFFDDFSNYEGYPNPNLWLNKDAFVNSTLCVDPINIGVVTLDGLDSLGNPRDIFNPLSHGPADTLISKPINLLGFSEIYFSFYFQPQGLGNAPEANDILKLEFKEINGSWSSAPIWDTTGYSLEYFQKIIIMITDSIYLHDSFQFRFSNHATLSGNFDHWHLDNILLTNDYNLILDNEDVSFISNKVKLFNEYYQIPWTHFNGNQTIFMQQQMDVLIRNNYSTTQSVDYRFDIYNSFGTSIYHYPTTGLTRNDDIFNYDSNGIFSYFQDADTSIVLYPYIFQDNSNQIEIFNIVQSIATDDSYHFKNNDTVSLSQEFLNFYALDDATAEASYGLNVSDAKTALKFPLIQPDSLKAVRIHFEQSLIDVSSSPFQIVVWEDDNGVPGNPIDTCHTLFYPEYTNDYNGFYEYVLDEPIYVSGSVFIGIQQIYSDILNIGLDRNTINNDKMYYKVGSYWQQSACLGCEGTWMLRPVFGSVTTTDLVTFEIDNYLVFPNPVSDFLKIQHKDPFSLRIYDLQGRLVYFSENLNRHYLVDVQDFLQDIYILEMISSSGIERRKIIIN